MGSVWVPEIRHKTLENNKLKGHITWSLELIKSVIFSVPHHMVRCEPHLLLASTQDSTELQPHPSLILIQQDSSPLNTNIHTMIYLSP